MHHISVSELARLGIQRPSKDNFKWPTQTFKCAGTFIVHVILYSFRWKVKPWCMATQSKLQLCQLWGSKKKQKTYDNRFDKKCG